MRDRASELLSAIGAGESTGVLLHDPSSMFYISGYTGEGVVLVSKPVRAVITDFRYTEQAEAEAAGYSVLMTDKNLSQEAIINELIGKHELRALYYEADYLTVSAFEACKAKIPEVSWIPLGGAVRGLREVKDEDELALIAKACEITGDAFERVLPLIREGVTEKEIALALDFDMMRHGASAPSFSTIVAAGAHGSLPHAVPGEYKIRRGDMITMDFGARYGGYCADMTRTVALGEPSAEMRRVYDIVYKAQHMAQDAVRAGMSCRDIDSIARDFIYASGYEGRFGHGLGHSLGVQIHEEPRFSVTTTATLRENQLMTVEPGVYLPGVGGVRIENTVIVKKDGCVPLTKPTRELIIL